MRPTHYLMTSILLCAALLITSCKGDTGATGPAGPQGSSYPTPTPVCANPSGQGLTVVGSGTLLPVGGNLFASGVTLTNPETATGISLYVSSGAVTGQIRFGIFNDNGSNYPGGLVYQTDPQNLVANSWNGASLPAIFLPAGTYWLAFEFSNSGNSIADNTSGGTYYWFTNGWAVMPDVFTAGRTSIPIDINLYLTTCP